MKIKSLFVLGIILVGILAMGVSASKAPFTGTLDGVNVTLTQVEVNDVDLDDSNRKKIEKTDELEILVAFEVASVVEDFQISAELTGYDKKDKSLLQDSSSVFDVDAGVSDDVTLNIELPVRMEAGNYNLKITVDSTEDRETFYFPVKLVSPGSLVSIRDVILSPSNGVKAGRALLVTVRVQNRGDSDEDDVKVTFSIPELGISASDYIGEIKADEDDDNKDSKSSEELYLRIPSCVEEGTYEAIVEVEYDDGDEVIEETFDVDVLADETCEADLVDVDDKAPTVTKTVITVGPESQDVAKGAGGVIYPVTITNAGSAKTYVISVTGGDWGTFRVSPTNVLTVSKDETKTAYVYAAANKNAVAGEQVFGVAIMSGDKTVEEVTLKANVVEGSASVDLKRALEIGLIVLVVILVILGLIIGFSKLKGSDEDKGEGESYY